MSKPQEAAPAAAAVVQKSPPTLAPVSREAAPRRSAVAAVLAADVHFHLVREPMLRLDAAPEHGFVRVRGRSARNDGTDLAVSAASDRIVFAELIRLLEREAAAGNAQAELHVLRLSEASIQDPGFLRYAAMRLQHAPQLADKIGFAVDESVLVKGPVALGGFFEGCERLGCFVIVEGFTLHAESLSILSTKALRAISFRLPSDRRDGKPSRAARAYAVAMTFFCKAMKIACIAQTGKPEANRRWLARIGIAYVE
jgi:EAL domain-containing protein (putative c-di-GMP-specific phosphodiesterase class I)